MDSRRLLGNFGVAAVAQAVSLLLSLFMSFIVPKLLGVEEYGYWQLFIFYSGYAGFFMLGVNDGVYLVNGGKPFGEVDKRDVASQFAASMAVQLLFGFIVGVAGALLTSEPERSFVLAATGAYLVVCNAAGYMGYVFQAANETRWYSISTIVDKVAFFVPLFVLVMLRVDVCEPYIISYLCSKCVSLVYCLVKGRVIFRQGLLAPRDAFRRAFASARVGMSLMLANVASMLVLGVARAVVDAEWGIEAFGQFSFALTLENFFLVFIQQLAMVLFPALRQATEKERKRYFVKLRDGLSLILPTAYLLYFPLCALVDWWLPAYSSALDYLGLLLPICVFESKMNLVGTTYFKVLRGERMLLSINVVTVAVSTLGVAVGVYAVGSLEFVMVWIVGSIAARSVYSERWTGAREGAAPSRLWVAEVLLTVLFMVSVAMCSRLVSFSLIAIALAAYWRFNASVIRSVVPRGVRRKVKAH